MIEEIFPFYIKHWKYKELIQPYHSPNSFFTSSVSPELLHWSACSRLLRKLARQIAFIFIESKAIFRKNATWARVRANLCNNSGETEEVNCFCSSWQKGFFCKRPWLWREDCLWDQCLLFFVDHQQFPKDSPIDPDIQFNFREKICLDLY